MPIQPNRLKNLQEGNIVHSINTITRIGEVGLKSVVFESLFTTAITKVPEQFKYGQHCLERYSKEANRLYGRIGLTPPSLEAFEAEGTDLQKLTNQFEEMSEEELDPQFVIAKTNLSLHEIERLYTNLREDTSIPDNPLRQDEKYDGIYISPIVWRHWRAHQPKPPLGVAGVTTASSYWTLRIIPSGKKAPIPNPGYTGRWKHSVAHPTINEYVINQASLIQSGRPLMDSSDPPTQTWLADTCIPLPSIPRILQPTIGGYGSGFVTICNNSFQGSDHRTILPRPARW